MTAHITDGYDCWCGPQYLDAESGTEMTRAQVEWTWDAVVTVHRDVPPRDDRRDHDRFPARVL